MSHRQKKDRGSKGGRSTKPTRASSSRSKPAATAEPTTAEHDLTGNFEYLEERGRELDRLTEEVDQLCSESTKGTKEYKESIRKNRGKFWNANNRALQDFCIAMQDIFLKSQSEEEQERFMTDLYNAIEQDSPLRKLLERLEEELIEVEQLGDGQKRCQILSRQNSAKYEAKMRLKETAIIGNKEAMDAAASTKEGKKAIEECRKKIDTRFKELQKTLKKLQDDYRLNLQDLKARQERIKEALDAKEVVGVPEDLQEAEQLVGTRWKTRDADGNFMAIKKNWEGKEDLRMEYISRK